MTDTNSVYTIREVNSGSCTFTKPEKFAGFHKSFINMNGSKGFILQTPKLVLRDSVPTSFDLLISRNKDRHREFYNTISHIEDTAILQITQNSEEWFGKKISRDQVETMFRSSIYRPLDINDPFIFKVNKVSELNIEQNYPVICLIKIDGIIFGRNSSTLDMKVLQVKVIKTEKIPSEDGGAADLVSTQQPEKPFYNDNVSVAPSNFTGRQQVPVPVPKPDTIDEINEIEEKIAETEINDEKIVELEKPRTPPTSPKSVAQSVHTVPVSIPESIPAPISVPEIAQISVPVPVPRSKDSLKCDLMKAMVENDFQRIQELSGLLKTLV
jgi:hypothetical protein